MRLTVLAAAFAALALNPALAQDYPNRNIVVVVPFAAGGPTDTIARMTALGMSKALNQQVLVENVVGAGGTIANAKVAAATPDGYTLLVTHVGLSTAATLYRKLPYDTKTAFQPIGLISDAPMTIIARADFPPNNLKELLAYMKANGEKISLANAGLGAASHLCGMLFMSAAQQQLTTVAYKGNAPIMNDLLGKHIDMTCDQATNTTEPIKGKLVKAYAITTKTRLPSLPDLPTADEAGLPGFEVNAWHGIYGPKGLPAPVVQKLTAALQAALQDPQLLKRFQDINTVAVSADRATPEALQKHLVAEVDKWAAVIKSAGVYAD